MELHLIRHPRTVAPVGVCYGATDLGLAADPRDAADRLRALLPARYTLASSPASRCLQLARLLDPKPLVDARLTEIDFGDWEMQAFEALPRTAIDAWAADPFGFRPPGGETADEMARRVLDGLNDLCMREHEALVIVGHGGPLRVIAGQLTGLPRIDWLGCRFDYARTTRIDIVAGSARTVWRDR
ncbi:MAG: histidine phosphatase family protein [Sterolibacteriaceae bacterium]|nr:histidine phosphatase family protein [Sterolibacteriaceae bacterium]MBK9087137.1 histidine phosphatase family protein [Sterolibacteriaceae bacterium]